LLSLSEELQVVHIADILVACFNELFCFLDALGSFADIFVIFKRYELSVD
jgi:hypothetical protein